MKPNSVRFCTIRAEGRVCYNHASRELRVTILRKPFRSVRVIHRACAEHAEALPVPPGKEV